MVYTNVEHRRRAAALARAGQLGRRLPRSAIRALLRAALGELRLALCLHRVGDSPALRAASMASMTIPARSLDLLIELLLASRPAAASPWLSVTFDDGYADAADYVASRAGRFPGVEFVFFVCPRKTESGAGFRWDASDAAERAGRAAAAATYSGAAVGDVLLENEREDLRGVGRQDAYRLADVDTVRALARLPNVELGNHTNGHFRPRLLTDEQASLEYARSAEDFDRLFGPARHFAFPYGTPGVDVEPRHIRIAGALAPLLWSTQGRPYARSDRRPGTLLPRFPVDGTLEPHEMASLIAARSAVARLRGRHQSSGLV